MEAGDGPHLNSSGISGVAESRQSEITFSAMFGLVSSLRFYSSRPFYRFASVVEEWIASEVSLYGVRPTEWLGAWLWLLPQNGKDSRRCLAERARSKQPKAPNTVSGTRNLR
jgi:hypothetical protein